MCSSGFSKGPAGLRSGYWWERVVSVRLGVKCDSLSHFWVGGTFILNFHWIHSGLDQWPVTELSCSLPPWHQVHSQHTYQLAMRHSLLCWVSCQCHCLALLRVTEIWLQQFTEIFLMLLNKPNSFNAFLCLSFYLFIYFKFPVLKNLSLCSGLRVTVLFWCTSWCLSDLFIPKATPGYN